MSEGLRLLRAILLHKSTEKIKDIDSDLFVGGDETDAYDHVMSHYRSYGVLPGLATVEDFMEMDFPEADEPVDFYLSV